MSKRKIKIKEAIINNLVDLAKNLLKENKSDLSFSSTMTLM